MKYRSYNEKNIDKFGNIYATYFRTKKEALAHQAKFGGVVERKMGYEWFRYE